MTEITVVGSILPSPTAAIEISGYQELGCYTELPANTSARVVGQNGAYLSLNIANLTIMACLQGCGSRLAPDSGGKYRIAAVENSRECYCGLIPSPAATIVSTEYCSSPCDGDPSKSCGGYGYLNLYRLQPSPSATSSTSSTSASLTHSSSTYQGSSARSRLSPAVVAVLSSIGGVLVVCALLLLLCNLYKRYNRQKQVVEILRAPPMPPAESPLKATCCSTRDNLVSPLSPLVQTNLLAAMGMNDITSDNNDHRPLTESLQNDPVELSADNSHLP